MPAVCERIRGIFLLLTLVLCRQVCLQAAAQQGVGAGIEDSITKDATVVERTDITEIVIESSRKASIHRKYVYTILNSQGDEYATIRTFYDKFNDLISATGVLYDAGGKVLKKIRKSEMEDWSTAGSGILMTDARVKYYHFYCRSYPYSVSFEEERELTGLFVLPEWRPQPSPGIAVENSSLVVSVPGGYPLRYKQYNYLSLPVVTEKKDGKVYTWELHNRPAVWQEPFAPSWYRSETCVRLAPGDFEEGGYKGRLYSWGDMGRFIGDLYKGRDRLPEAAKAKVHSLADSCTDDREKISLLYHFLQQDTHYVGIELGIGGWQPFDAAYVYNKKYGDCKALANYMVALLKEAGVRACNVLVRAGPSAPAIDTGFACNQFNHAIAVAFTGKDSIWLECTNPLLAPGYLGGFTSDRDVLLLNDSGGRIVHTPVYGVKDNRFVRTVRGSIDDNGALQARIWIGYAGLEQDALQAQLGHMSKKELTGQRQQSLGISNCTVSDLTYREPPTAIPSIEETMQVAADHYAAVSGNRLFITPGAFLKNSDGIKGGNSVGTKEGTHPRRSDPELATSCQETDSIILRLPHGYVPEGALPAASYSAAFGSYRLRCEFSGDSLVLTCRFRQIKGIYPPGAWSGMAYLFNLIHRESDMQLVFIKQ
jgi:hypothetical protein